MIASASSLFFALLSISSAQQLARRVPQELAERSVRTQGGWALLAEKFCPNDLSICGSDQWCCPTSMTCQNFGGPTNVCCPGPESCSATYTATPYCADDTWTLWDVTRGGINKNGYFCCSPGLVGLLSAKCVNPNTVTDTSLQAMAIMPGGGVLSTSVQTVVVPTTAVVTGTTVLISGTTVTSVATSVSTATATKLSTVGSTSVNALSTTTSTSVAAVSASGTSTYSSASSSPSASATKASDGNSLKGFGLGLFALAGGALFVGAVL